MRRIFALAACLLVVSLQVAVAEVNYARQIKPLLKHKCYACHGALKQQSALRLDTAKAIFKGGDRGSALDLKAPAASLLLKAIRGTAGFQMPPDGQGTRLTAAESKLIETWIREGAKAPADEQPQVNPTEYWSYRLPAAHDIPIAGENWAKNSIDRFIAQQHKEHGLIARPSAGPAIWLRRVYVDLIGLPPTRKQLAEFMKRCGATKNKGGKFDPAKLQQLKEQVVDALLATPQYGERWGRHWMDIWRYSDWYGSRGINEIRYSQRHIWRWRDWIVDSLNDDKGYDRMVREMLAADEIAPTDPQLLAATGFLGRNWYKFDRNVWMFDTVERTSEAFLGLKLKCCRCHDHKYDPISHAEYYQFRAFFEPHNVRTDPISALSGTIKDATLGMVPKEGIARIYDKEQDAKTFRFERGDNRYPDESNEMLAGVPTALGGLPISIKPVQLPVSAFYPSLRRSVSDSLLANSDQTIKTSIEALKKASDELAVAEQKLKDVQAHEKTKAQTGRDSKQQTKFLHDDFSKEDAATWKVVSGNWKYEDGHLIEKHVTSFATMVTTKDHPWDMYVRFKYRPLKPGTLRSIGFSFDYQDQTHSQDVYTSTGDSRQSIQAFHRDGKHFYPRPGIVKTSLKVGELTTVEAYVRGSRLQLKLNGEDKLSYLMPIARRAGKFAIWVHVGMAEIHELEITELIPSLADAKQTYIDALQNVMQKKSLIEIARAEKRCLEVRIEAELAKYSTRPPEAERAKQLAIQADVCERQIAVLQQQAKSNQASATLDMLKRQSASELDSKPHENVKTEIAKAEKQVEIERQKLKKLQLAIDQPDGQYAPVGEIFPATSTGRRKALARWIASEKNPRTARVAANHIWGRHFGIPLVLTPDNFGLNGARPSHLELLDWLALELIRHDWKMKPLHRQIVLSATYAMLSSDGDDAVATTNKEKDRDNKFLWRMNSRRMDAEVVRDGVLHLTGQLDLQRGGPEIAQDQGEKILRRSLYFRNTPNEKMLFLEVFDVADPNACYRRKESVVPHQALALMNSGLAQDGSRKLAKTIWDELDTDKNRSAAFVNAAFEHVLSRLPKQNEAKRCLSFLNQQVPPELKLTAFPAGGTSKIMPASEVKQRRREELIHVMFLHNDFVTVR